MIRVVVRLLGASALAASAACDVHEPVVIPAGAQVVRVTVSDDEVALVPAAVRAGDVYLVIEGPAQGFEFVSRKPAPDAPASGMTRAQIQRVAAGDFQSTSLEGFSVTCGPEAWTEERHWEDCGENVYLELPAGLYAILAGSEEPGMAPVMAVLEVTP